LFEVKIKNKPNIFFPKSFSDELGGVVEAPLRMLSLTANIPNCSLKSLVAAETTQQHLSSAVDSHRQSLLLEKATDPHTQARLRFLTLPFAGIWLNVIPSKSLSLNLLPQEFRQMSLYRLGVPLHPSDTSWACPACGEPSDLFAPLKVPESADTTA
jgi:hypothetical protein